MGDNFLGDNFLRSNFSGGSNFWGSISLELNEDPCWQRRWNCPDIIQIPEAINFYHWELHLDVTGILDSPLITNLRLVQKFWGFYKDSHMVFIFYFLPKSLSGFLISDLRSCFFPNLWARVPKWLSTTINNEHCEQDLENIVNWTSHSLFLTKNNQQLLKFQ